MEAVLLKYQSLINYYKKRKLKNKFSHKYRYKNPKQNTRQQNSAIYKGDYTLQISELYHRSGI